MTSRTKFWALSAGALALSLALAGCGSSGGGGGSVALPAERRQPEGSSHLPTTPAPVASTEQERFDARTAVRDALAAHEAAQEAISACGDGWRAMLRCGRRRLRPDNASASVAKAAAKIAHGCGRRPTDSAVSAAAQKTTADAANAAVGAAVAMPLTAAYRTYMAASAATEDIDTQDGAKAIKEAADAA